MHQYAWRLEVGVWRNARAEGDGVDYGPRLVLVRRAQRRPEAAIYDGLLGYVQFEPHRGRDAPAAWVAYHYPDDGGDLMPAYSETSRSAEAVTLLRAGETKHPRDSAQDALAALLARIGEQVAPAEFAGVKKAAATLLEPLRQAVDAFVRRSGR